MSLNDAALLTGATITPSGGTPLVFTSAGSSQDKNVLVVPADTDLRTRREIACTVKYPKVQPTAPNGYTQARATAILKSPLTLDNGGITMNTLSIVMAVDVETSDAEKAELMCLGSQLLADSDFTNFFKNLIVE